MSPKNTLEKFAPINNICLMILAGCAATWVLIYTKTMLMPFVIALFISMVAGTLANKMKKNWNLKSDKILIYIDSYMLKSVILFIEYRIFHNI